MLSVTTSAAVVIPSTSDRLESRITCSAPPDFYDADSALQEAAADALRNDMAAMELEQQAEAASHGMTLDEMDEALGQMHDEATLDEAARLNGCTPDAQFPAELIQKALVGIHPGSLRRCTEYARICDMRHLAELAMNECAPIRHAATLEMFRRIARCQPYDAVSDNRNPAA